MSESALPRSVLLTAVLASAVIVGALVSALLLRPETPAPAAGGIAHPVPSTSATNCGDEPCQVIAGTSVNGMKVDLLADSDGGTGRLRAGGPASGTVSEVSITTMGVQLNHDSLRCAETETPVCLVRGPHDGGMAGEVHVWRGDSWQPAPRPYFSDAGNVVLDDASGDATPEVVVVRHECGDAEDACEQSPVLAKVFDLQGGEIGCTGTYGSPGSLRGWPDVDVEEYELSECPS
ncbi:hypothetical protein [Prauserella cavernicola]|uniref:Uncharacterized protein n=1 Tax=Prauserella cavernicola TaxID=2800127 RepID=A0A934V907_9PSEU|nr:hypothetical protein [Prauserella cavernicola]MBK1788830.1 hypothetical protein [Prauserella cavernicola]